MSGRKTNGVFKVITYIVLALVLVAAIGLIIRFTNGGITDFKTFYVQVGETLYTEDSEIQLTNEPIRFETKYTFASNEAGKHKGYKVQIVPTTTSETDFDFTVDGQVYLFGAESDFTAAFNIQYDETGFALLSPLSLESILQTTYDGHTVVVPQEVSKGATETVYFNMIVSAYNDSQSIVIGLRLYPYVTGIDIDGGTIII